MPWQPPLGRVGYQDEPPRVCAGYTTSLPEVFEVAQARVHWKHGAIEAFCGDDKPTEELLQAVLILEGAMNAVDMWRVTPARDGGGAA
jgi:hypothetical protein